MLAFPCAHGVGGHVQRTLHRGGKNVVRSGALRAESEGSYQRTDVSRISLSELTTNDMFLSIASMRACVEDL